MKIYEWITATLQTLDELGDQVFPVIADGDAAAPYAIYRIENMTGIPTLDNPSGDMDRGSIEVVVWREQYSAAWDLAMAVNSALHAAVPADGECWLKECVLSDVGKDLAAGLYGVAVRTDYKFRINSEV